MQCHLSEASNEPTSCWDEAGIQCTIDLGGREFVHTPLRGAANLDEGEGYLLVIVS